MKAIILILLLLSSLFGNIGEVTAIKGEATLYHNKSTQSIKKAQKITQNDRIKTAAKTKVQVVLKDETIITIGPKSEYLFDEYVESGDVKVKMSIRHGFFKAVTGKIGKIAPSRFKIKTQAATIGVRGTQFVGYVSINEERIGCIKGTIIVYTAKRNYIIHAGEMIVYKNGFWEVEKLDLQFFAPVMLGIAFIDWHGDQLTLQPHRELAEEVIVRRVPGQGTPTPPDDPVDPIDPDPADPVDPPTPVVEPYEISGSTQTVQDPPPFIPVTGVSSQITPVDTINMTLSPFIPTNTLPFNPPAGTTTSIAPPTPAFDATSFPYDPPVTPPFRP